jgi:hypothetical protein
MDTSHRDYMRGLTILAVAITIVGAVASGIGNLFALEHQLRDPLSELAMQLRIINEKQQQLIAQQGIMEVEIKVQRDKISTLENLLREHMLHSKNHAARQRLEEELLIRNIGK